MDLVAKAMEVRSTCKGGMGYALVGGERGVTLSVWGRGGRWDGRIFATIRDAGVGSETTGLQELVDIS